MKTKTKRCFTLLEIGLCVMILSIVAGLVGFQAKKMVSAHRFHTSMENLLSDLRRIQVISLSALSDIKMKITKGEKGYEYTLQTDEILEKFRVKKRSEPLSGVEKITVDGKPLKSPLTITLYGNGQMDPQKKVTFEQAKEAYVLDLTAPLSIELKRKIPVAD